MPNNKYTNLPSYFLRASSDYNQLQQLITAHIHFTIDISNAAMNNDTFLFPIYGQVTTCNTSDETYSWWYEIRRRGASVMINFCILNLVAGCCPNG